MFAPRKRMLWQEPAGRYNVSQCSFIFQWSLLDVNSISPANLGSDANNLNRVSMYGINATRVDDQSQRTAQMLQSSLNSPLVAEQLAAIFFGAVTLATVSGHSSESDLIIGYCLGGSVIGSWAYILIFRVNEHRDVVGAFLGNALLAFAFSPSICEWIIPPQSINIRSCMFVSASMGLCSSWVITVFFPEVGKKLLTAIRKMKPSTVWIFVRNSVARLLGLEVPKGPGHE